eukprot:TRINITY_DN12646_c0_g1_i1.p2 TRINITY_DN12646_c0_g1~~TRINITY_DN12646_c0_g1_i1.p2  ORF type:complete len:197 (+),score=61.79 TRINITY_DN12646_c0_g1_i1:61-591(+)
MPPKVYVANLHSDLTRSDLVDLCGCFGEVASAQLVQAGQKQFGIVEFALLCDARECFRNLNGCRVDGRVVTLRSVADVESPAPPAAACGFSPGSSSGGSRLTVPWPQGEKRGRADSTPRRRRRRVRESTLTPPLREPSEGGDGVLDMLPTLPPLPAPADIAAGVPLPPSRGTSASR